MCIINVASHTKCCCTSHIHSIALNSCPAERSAFPQQKYPHGWAKAQNLQAVWKFLPKAAACPPQAGKGILALLPLADDDSSKRKRNYFYLASKLLFLGDKHVFSPLYPVLQAASDRKTKNPTKNKKSCCSPLRVLCSWDLLQAQIFPCSCTGISVPEQLTWGRALVSTSFSWE